MEIYPALEPIFIPQGLVLMGACLVLISLIIPKKDILSVQAAGRSSILHERATDPVRPNIMESYLSMPCACHRFGSGCRAMTAMHRGFNPDQMLLQVLTALVSLISACLLFPGLTEHSPLITLCTAVFMLTISVVTHQLLGRRIDRVSSQGASAKQEVVEPSTSGMGELLIYQQQPIFLMATCQHVEASFRARTFFWHFSTIPACRLESCGVFPIWLALLRSAHAKPH